jgi:hypothetical protein
MTSHNQYADYLEDITVTDADKNLGNINLLSKMELLREVVIKTGSIKIKETPQVTELVIFK